MKLIKLTSEGKTIWVNPQMIQLIGTDVYTNTELYLLEIEGHLTVSESPEEIERMLLLC
jgi:hypothetical protein